MPQPAIDHAKYISRIPTHTTSLPAASNSPITHYTRAASDAWGLLLYMRRNLGRVYVYRARADAHIVRLRVMVMLTLAEAFERFLKELAAVCVDHVGPVVADDRLDVFTVKGAALSLHFGVAGSLGKALCESYTWCECDETNRRFRRILADPHTDGTFYLFPSSKQQPVALRDRGDVMSVIWQLRHSIVHNQGVITASDAQKFRVLCRQPVAGPKSIAPEHGDVWYVKLFLDETAEKINEAVHTRLTALLTAIHGTNPDLFDAGAKAGELSNLFRRLTTISGQTRNPA